MTTAFDRAVAKIVSLEALDDAEDTDFWAGIFRVGLDELFSDSDDIVTEIAKSLQQSFTGRDDTWELLDPARQDRLWKARAKDVLFALKQAYSD